MVCSKMRKAFPRLQYYLFPTYVQHIKTRMARPKLNVERLKLDAQY